jgi:hypothetical protein
MLFVFLQQLLSELSFVRQSIIWQNNSTFANVQRKQSAAAFLSVFGGGSFSRCRL